MSYKKTASLDFEAKCGRWIGVPRRQSHILTFPTLLDIFEKNNPYLAELIQFKGVGKKKV